MLTDDERRHLDLVAERVADPHTLRDARRRSDAIHAKFPSKVVEGLLDRLQNEKTVEKKVLWLRVATDALAQAAKGNVPCRAGCNSCCHMATIITVQEAEAIAAYSGRTRAQVPDAIYTQADQVDRDKWSGVPCPFVTEAGCRVYEVRPYSCRKHYSVDRDALLCRIIPGHMNMAPSYNAQTIDIMYVLTYGDRQRYARTGDHGMRMADIRDFFPTEGQ